MDGGQKPKKAVNKDKKKVGKFIIDFHSQLGSGQFGKVYVAENQETKQLVAVKTIKKDEMYQDKYTKDALVREIEIMRNLKSPNIISFVQISETSNNIYIFQQLANEGTLDDLLQKNKRFEEKVALEYIVQILTGFAELIKHGIIHRDIKATNILVKDKILKIADFGMSRYSGKMSYMQSFVGTPFYMAPQILSQGKYSYKCDIWSLGVLFYQMVTGTIPWKLGRDCGLQDLLAQIKEQCKHTIQFPANVKISDLFKDFVSGCLKYEEEDRLDWEHIFGHKIFEGKFKNTDSDIENFTLTQLRLKVHCNNLNLEKLIAKLPEKLTKEDFFNFVKALNPQISTTELNNLFKLFSKQKQTVNLQQITFYFQDHGIKMSGLKGKGIAGQEQHNKLEPVIQKIIKGIEQKSINVFQLYKKFDKNQQNKLTKTEFQDFIHSICSDISNEDIDRMFIHFNNQEQKISIAFETFYESFCKAVQIPALKDEKVSEGIKKMEERKKTH